MKILMFKKYLVCLLLMGVFICSGCGEKIVDKRPSSQRFLLEKIMVDTSHIDPDLHLKEKNVVAHNGFGWVDISGMENSNKNELTAFQKSMVRMVAPKGNLEGYARASYSTADCADAVTVRYFLTRYPIDYLQKSEVSSASAENGEEFVLNNDEKSEENHHLTDFRKVSLEAVDVSNEFAGRSAFKIKARGIIVDVSADSRFAEKAEKCAELIAARIEKEITERYALLGEIIESRGDRPPPKVGLQGFMGHLEEHLDMGRKEYQPFRKKF